MLNRGAKESNSCRLEHEVEQRASRSGPAQARAGGLLVALDPERAVAARLAAVAKPRRVRRKCIFRKCIFRKCKTVRFSIPHRRRRVFSFFDFRSSFPVFPTSLKLRAENNMHLSTITHEEKMYFSVEKLIWRLLERIFRSDHTFLEQII